MLDGDEEQCMVKEVEGRRKFDHREILGGDCVANVALVLVEEGAMWWWWFLPRECRPLEDGTVPAQRPRKQSGNAEGKMLAPN